MKLYWRIKKDGKWTWKAADTVCPVDFEIPDNLVWVFKEEEE